MQLDLHLTFAGRTIEAPVELAKLAEKLGFGTIWAAEAYGSDAITPLAYLAAHTERIKLGTGIAHMYARSPTCAAMTFATLDQLAGGNRVVAGFGTSGPQIVEGWHGRPWMDGYNMISDYVAIIRKTLRREGPVEHDGAAISLPTRDPQAKGMGKAVKSILHGNPDLPIYLGTAARTTVELTAQIADGWFTPLHFIPQSMPKYRRWLDEGAKSRDPRLGPLSIQSMVFVEATDTPEETLQRFRQGISFYASRMGHADKHFYNQMMARQGYPEAAARLLELAAEGRFEEAVEATPLQYCRDLSIFGGAKEFERGLRAWEDAGVTNLALVTRQPQALKLAAEVMGVLA